LLTIKLGTLKCCPNSNATANTMYRQYWHSPLALAASDREAAVMESTLGYKLAGTTPTALPEWQGIVAHG